MVLLPQTNSLATGETRPRAHFSNSNSLIGRRAAQSRYAAMSCHHNQPHAIVCPSLLSFSMLLLERSEKNSTGAGLAGIVALQLIPFRKPGVVVLVITKRLVTLVPVIVERTCRGCMSLGSVFKNSIYPCWLISYFMA